jgi:hypothetical protein
MSQTPRRLSLSPVLVLILLTLRFRLLQEVSVPQLRMRQREGFPKLAHLQRLQQKIQLILVISHPKCLKMNPRDRRPSLLFHPP